MPTSERSEGLARVRAKVRRRHARGAATCSASGHERREQGCRGTPGEVAKTASLRIPRRQAVDDPMDVAETEGEPILDANGMREVDGHRGHLRSAVHSHGKDR